MFWHDVIWVACVIFVSLVVSGALALLLGRTLFRCGARDDELIEQARRARHQERECQARLRTSRDVIALPHDRRWGAHL